jgi:hypothetical protein
MHIEPQSIRVCRLQLGRVFAYRTSKRSPDIRAPAEWPTIIFRSISLAGTVAILLRNKNDRNQLAPKAERLLLDRFHDSAVTVL